MKVFISSTYKDLIEYRAAAIRAVEGTNYQASKMEVFGARPDEPLDACLKEVEESDLFIGIYALRYGFVPEGADISITEMEYAHAKKLGKPIYCFILDEENQPWLFKWIEDEPGKSKLLDFKRRILKEHICDFFTTSDDLGMKVATALSFFVAKHQPISIKVFLCHASIDKPKVRELYQYLKQRDIIPWLDAEDLIPGQKWEEEIPKALDASDAIIVCLSKSSVDKEGYVQKEIKFALDKALEIPEGRIFLIPARLEECQVPRSLRSYHWVDLFDKSGYEKLMKALRLRADQLY